MSGQKELNPMDERKLDSGRGVENEDRKVLEQMKRLEKEKRDAGKMHRLVMKNGAIVDTTRPDWYPKALKRYHDQWG